MEAISKSEHIDKQNMIWINSGILFSLEKAGNFDTCCNVDETWWSYANKISQLQNNKYCMIPLIWDS